MRLGSRAESHNVSPSGEGVRGGGRQILKNSSRNICMHPYHVIVTGVPPPPKRFDFLVYIHFFFFTPRLLSWWQISTEKLISSGRFEGARGGCAFFFFNHFYTPCTIVKLNLRTTKILSIHLSNVWTHPVQWPLGIHEGFSAILLILKKKNNIYIMIFDSFKFCYSPSEYKNIKIRTLGN